MITTHILKMKCGVSVEGKFNEENANFSCAWTPEPPFTKKLHNQIKEEYVPWRNDIFDQWSKKTGKKVLLASI